MNFNKLLLISTVFFILFSFSPISVNFNELPAVSKTYATETKLTQLKIDQMSGVLQSLQNIFNQLKQKVRNFINSQTKIVQAATETIGLVRQDCTGYSNCFTSLSAWEAAYGGISFGVCAQGDLVCADKIAVAQIDGAWTNPDTTKIIISGWTTDATHYIKIYTTTSARHNGKWDNNKYRLENSSIDDVITVSQSYITIDGLQIKQLGNNDGIFSNSPYAGTGQVIKNNIIWGAGSWTTARHGIFWAGTASDEAVYNNIVYGFTYSGSYGISLTQYPRAITPYIYNNTVYGNDKGILADSDAYLSNNLSYNNTTADFSGTPKSGSGNNFSKDNTAPGTNSIHGTTDNKTPDFISATSGSEDFHIQSTSAAVNAGADLSTTFTTDIDNETRSAPWDIGADEVGGVSPPSPPSDTTPPVLSSGAPIGALAAGTTETTLSVSTLDENSTCKYGTVANTAYPSIANTFITTGALSHSQTITGLTNGTSYNYYIRCSDTAGNANTTDYIISFSVASPSPPAGDTTPPTVSITSPANGATVSGTISVTANATDNAGITGIQFKLDTNTLLGIEDTTSPYSYSLNTTTITDGSHTLIAVARDTSNNYATSSIITITINNASPPPLDTQAPTIPAGPTATAISSSQINLSWSASTDPAIAGQVSSGVSGYKIYRCVGSTCAPTIQIATSNTNSYLDTSLTASTAYTYAVSAYDAAGNESNKSVLVSVITSILSAGTETAAIFFSDIESGPKTGLSDGLGEGAVVSIWGRNFGNSQGTSEVYIGGQKASYVYYWGNADGLSSSGPADLYQSHKMQTISFSVPSSAPDGLTSIYIVVNGKTSNAIPFTVRSGNIYFVKTTGSDTAGVGSWVSPWGTLNYIGSGAGGKIKAGDIIYATDGVKTTNGLAVRENVDGISGQPISLIAYPNAKVILYGNPGVSCVICNFFKDAEYWNFAKLTIQAQVNGMTTFKEGRIVANEITNEPGFCASGWGGAITQNNISSNGAASGIKVIGNYIHDFGCDSTISGHHVFYISNRSGVLTKSYELGWNYLNDNKVNGGLHIYDQDACGDWEGPMNVHDNVVKNQRGRGFYFNGSCSGGKKITVDVNIYNNLFINVGLGPNFSDVPNTPFFNAIVVGGTISSNMKFYNNTVYGYGEASNPQTAIIFGGSGTYNWKNNIVVDTKNIAYYSSFGPSSSISSNNLWYNGGDGNPLNPPSWDISPLTSDPLFNNVATNDYSLTSNSPAIDSGANLASVVSNDIDGVLRPQGNGYDIGAYEYVTGSITPPADTIAPSVPSGLSISVISPSQLNLSWSASTDPSTGSGQASSGVSGYKIYRCTGSACSPTTQIATSNTTSYSDTGLTASTAYTYAVSAYDAANNESAKSSSVSSTTQSPTPQCSDLIDNDNDTKIDMQDPDCSSPADNNEQDTAPPQISSIISTTLSTTTTRIDFTTNESATHQIEYGFTTSYGASTTIDTTLSTSHSVLLSNLSPDNTTYNFRVRSKDASGNEAISINYTFITPGLTDTISPASTTDLAAKNITQTSVDLVTWTAAGDDGNQGTAYQFDIRYSTQELTENTWNDSSIIRATGEPTPKPAGSLMNYTLVGLTPNTTYKVALKTLDEILNQSPISNIITFTTLAAQTTPSTPSTSSGQATSGGGSSGGSSSGGSSSSGGGSSFILSDTTPPPQITELQSTGADSQSRLTWKNPSISSTISGQASSSAPHPDWVRTIVVRKLMQFATTTHATSTKDGEIVYEGKDNEFVDTKLRNNATYLYSIFTIDRVPNYSQPATTTVKTIEGKTSTEIETITKEQETITKQIPITKTQTIQIPKNFFKRNLKLGMRGNDVKKLQQILFDNKTELITGYFGKQTKAALIKFQEKYKEDILTPNKLKKGNGYFGKSTIKKIQELYGKKEVKKEIKKIKKIVKKKIVGGRKK